MTGKRPRALTRTASVSQLGPGAGAHEASPLVEKRKATTGVVSAPRVVIGFDPKPGVRGASFHLECAGVDSPKSAPCSPCFIDKASSPRSVLNSLFSRQRCWRHSDVVGLGIALLAAEEEEGEGKAGTSAQPVVAPPPADRIAAPDRSLPRAREIPARSHPIPTPGISPYHLSPHARGKPSHQPVARPALDWLDPDALQLDRRDTFLLSASPPHSLRGDSTLATSHFLDECSFCMRHLPDDKDIFMYRGDKAFCSVECRSQQMLMDERTNNCSSSALRRAPVAAA